jgi:transcriptional regulator with XRE-family HTH domain
MERDLQPHYQLDWPEVVAAAKRRRKEMKMTQRRLAAAAGVSLPTVVKFEAAEDIRLSSALAILKMLDMIVPPVEGTLQIHGGGATGKEAFQATFAPYAGQGGALEPRTLNNLSALEEFLNELRIGEQEKQRAFTGLTQGNAASIPHVQLSPAELRRCWPLQFSAWEKRT